MSFNKLQNSQTNEDELIKKLYSKSVIQFAVSDSGPLIRFQIASNINLYYKYEPELLILLPTGLPFLVFQSAVYQYAVTKILINQICDRFS